MGVLQDFERRLEGAVEGFFARAFRSGLQPVELAKAVRRYAEDNQHVTADGVVVPNVYRIRVSPRDHERLAGFGASLPRELAEVVVRTASERGWLLRGPGKVRIEVGDDVRFGMYALTARVEAVGDGQPSPRSQPATPSRPAAPAAPAPATPAREEPRSPIEHTQVVSSTPRAGLQLRVVSGADAGRTAPVSGQRMTLGRLSSCDVPIQDSTVSREHAALVRRGGAWWVIDLGSTNGTRVNGVKAAEQPVHPGDRLELGDAVLELVEG
jgi:predicted component of type VI protein secretion system